MAIVPLSKLTIYGMSDQQQLVLDQLQQLGCVHLVPLRESEQTTTLSASNEAKAAHRYLVSSPIKRRLTSDASEFQRETLVHQILGIRDRSEQLKAERDALQDAIELLVPWGDFQLPSKAELRGQELYFYCVQLSDQSDFPENHVQQVVARDNRFAYIVVIAGEEPTDIPFEPVELDRRPLSQLRHELEQVEEELEELQWERITLTRWRQLLEQDLDAADDQAAKAMAASGVQADDAVFAIQGWMPTAASDDVRSLADQNGLAITIESPTDDESPPTLLKNPNRVAGAEGCVTFYMTPGYHTWDPTPVVFFSFSLFFAMIIADAGYGLFMAALLAIAWGKIGEHKAGPRIRNLLVGIVTATIIYGVIVGSYFGVEPPPGSPLDALRVRIGGEPMMKSQNAMMLIAVAIGITHLSLANILSALSTRRQLRCLGHFGWAMVMIGAFVLGMGVYLEIDLMRTIGVGLASVGGIAILFFSSERPLLTLSPKTHALRLVDGVMQVSNLSKAFGDVLSYLRLFALGLASAQLAITFNNLAGGAFEKGGIGIVLAIVILFVGHGINFLLGLMGGVVHGLRLNCIEFFNWGLSQEGYAFEPFKKKANR